DGRPMLVLAFAVALAPVFLWKRPDWAPFTIVAAALLIEQFPEIAGSQTLIGTSAKIPLFHGLGGFRPSDLLLGFLGIAYLVKRGDGQVAFAAQTPLRRGVGALMAAVVFAILFGVAT